MRELAVNQNVENMIVCDWVSVLSARQVEGMTLCSKSDPNPEKSRVVMVSRMTNTNISDFLFDQSHNQCQKGLQYKEKMEPKL
jgi:3-deoxy-D-arabino-heptulosonate 7-phosphate (DAHP) synthase class II